MLWRKWRTERTKRSQCSSWGSSLFSWGCIRVFPPFPPRLSGQKNVLPTNPWAVSWSCTSRRRENRLRLPCYAALVSSGGAGAALKDKLIFQMYIFAKRLFVMKFTCKTTEWSRDIKNNITHDRFDEVNIVLPARASLIRWYAMFVIKSCTCAVMHHLGGTATYRPKLKLHFNAQRTAHIFLLTNIFIIQTSIQFAS